MIGIRGWKSPGRTTTEGSDVRIACGWEESGVVGGNGVRIRREARQGCRSAGNPVEDVCAIRTGIGRTDELKIIESLRWRIGTRIRRDGNLFLVVVQPISTTQHELSVELRWAPVEAYLRTKVALLRRPQVAALADGKACKEACA